MINPAIIKGIPIITKSSIKAIPSNIHTPTIKLIKTSITV
jgi:hypothetical protein